MKFELTIPTELSDIKLSQYLKYLKTTKDVEDEYFIGKQMISIFCNVPDELVNKIRAKDFNSIIEAITEVLQQKPKFKPTFKMGGIEYGFIPNLDEITLGEKVDLDEYFKEFKTMDKAMNVLYRPITLKRSNGYLIEDYKANGEGLDTPLDVAFGANVFFSTLINDLLNYTQNYIKAEVAANPKASQILEKSGVGTQAFISSLEEIFLNLMTWQNYHSTKHY